MTTSDKSTSDKSTSNKSNSDKKQKSKKTTSEAKKKAALQAKRRKIGTVYEYALMTLKNHPSYSWIKCYEEALKLKAWEEKQ